jgi:hypothetical protein
MRQTTERWKELCLQASTEYDSERLLELVQEINSLIREKYIGAKKVEDDRVGKRIAS